MFVIVPNHVSDAINAALDNALKAMGTIEAEKAEKERKHLYAALLDYYNENGAIPDFKIVSTNN
jgi:hypothetical protein